MKTLVIIPSRLSATRLPGKPLLKISGLSIISHVMKKAESANIGEVLVAAEDQEIIDDVKKNGGQAILTKNCHKTGTDRIFEAINKLGNKSVELVMNLQGDEPLMNTGDIKKLHNKMIQSKDQFGTLASNILEKNVLEKQSLVKVITKDSLNDSNFPEAKDFKREIINETKNIYHHLGIYCYQFEKIGRASCRERV